MICMVATIASIIGIVFAAGFDSYYSNIMGILISRFDIAINALCMVLQWPFARVYYKKLCFDCHVKLTRFYTKDDNCNYNYNENITKPDIVIINASSSTDK